MYSGGNGEVYALGVVAHSHITVVTYSVEDGEIIKQVNTISCSYIKCINLDTVVFLGLNKSD